MHQRLNVVTLGVRDLDRARRFYCEGLGWHPSALSTPEVVFIPVGGVVLALFPRHLLAEDAGLPQGGAGQGFGGITVSQNVASAAEVDAALQAAVAAGGSLLKPGQAVPWGGYAGYFADPDGHPWEIAYNPHWPLAADGRVSLPG